MRYRRRNRRENMSARRKFFCELMDRNAVRAEVLSLGVGEAIKCGPDLKGLLIILDMVAMELIPAMEEQDRYFNLVYHPGRLIARTRKNPKPRKTAPKSANGKTKTV